VASHKRFSRAPAGLYPKGLDLKDSLTPTARTAAICCASGNQGIVHDAFNGARATSALRATAKATIDFSGRTRARPAAFDGGADVVIGQNVAGTNDHVVVTKYSWDVCIE
jgi:hypothetical protein